MACVPASSGLNFVCRSDSAQRQAIYRAGWRAEGGLGQALSSWRTAAIRRRQACTANALNLGLIISLSQQLAIASRSTAPRVIRTPELATTDIVWLSAHAHTRCATPCINGVKTANDCFWLYWRVRDQTSRQIGDQFAEHAVVIDATLARLPTSSSPAVAMARPEAFGVKPCPDHDKRGETNIKPCTG